MINIKNLTTLRSSFHKKSGQLPGTPVYTGETPTEAMKVLYTRYDQKEVVSEPVEHSERPAGFISPGMVNWVHVQHLNNKDLLSKISAGLHIHPLLLEDALNTAHPPKIEEYGDLYFMTLKDIRLEGNQLKSAHVSLFLGKDFVYSLEEGAGKFSTVLGERLQKNQGRLRSKGHDYLLYSILDYIIDQYFYVIDVFREQSENLEEQLINEPSTDHIQEILALKNQLMFFRRYLQQLNKVFIAIFKEEYSFVTESNRVFYNDAAEHVAHALEASEHLRELTVNMVDLNNNNLNNKMNGIMKTLTLVAAIFIPLTFLAGIYGMNFEYMPELSWKYAYFTLLGLMVVITAGMVYYMKRKGWFK